MVMEATPPSPWPSPSLRAISKRCDVRSSQLCAGVPTQPMLAKPATSAADALARLFPPKGRGEARLVEAALVRLEL